MRAETGAPVIAAAGFTGVFVALAMARMRSRGTGRGLMLAFAWSAVATLLFVVCDYRLPVCEHCGRADEHAGWASPAAAARRGRWATYVAVVVLCLYAATRSPEAA